MVQADDGRSECGCCVQGTGARRHNPVGVALEGHELGQIQRTKQGVNARFLWEVGLEVLTLCIGSGEAHGLALCREFPGEGGKVTGAPIARTAMRSGVEQYKAGPQQLHPALYRFIG